MYLQVRWSNRPSEGVDKSMMEGQPKISSDRRRRRRRRQHLSEKPITTDSLLLVNFPFQPTTVPMV